MGPAGTATAYAYQLVYRFKTMGHINATVDSVNKNMFKVHESHVFIIFEKYLLVSIF
jgi:hypothetical protein